MQVSQRDPYSPNIKRRNEEQRAAGAGRGFSHEFVTEPYVCSLYECKSHKETCIDQTYREEVKEQETAGAGRDFHAKFVSEPYVCWLYGCKSHKETRIHRT